MEPDLEAGPAFIDPILNVALDVNRIRRYGIQQLDAGPGNVIVALIKRERVLEIAHPDATQACEGVLSLGTTAQIQRRGCDRLSGQRRDIEAHIPSGQVVT